MDNVTCVRCGRSIARSASLMSATGIECAACNETDENPAEVRSRLLAEPEGNFALGVVGGLFVPFGYLVIRSVAPGRLTRIGALTGTGAALLVGLALAASGVLR